MGHHYIPRAYLRNFASVTDSDRIWMYDKKRGKTYHSLIKEVAQKPRFYKSDVEISLATDFEEPGTRAIKRVILGVPLSSGEREDLSRYIAAMIKRVPFHRTHVNTTLYPELLAQTATEYREMLRTLATKGNIPAHVVDQKLAETDAAEQKLRNDMPPNVREIVEDPRPRATSTDTVGAALASFHWQVLKCSGPSFFLTTDNPVYRYSKIIFPLSSTHCLYGDPQQPGESLDFSKAKEADVRAINRQIANYVNRYAYYNEDVPWIHKLLKRKS
jgi:Protein of unknown function (DUF4238)